MKKVISLVMSVVLLISAIPAFSVLGADGDSFTVGDLTYTVLDETAKTVSVKGATVTDYEGGPDTTVSGDVEIPETVTNGGSTYTVTAIAAMAFYCCMDLTSITIPDTVTSIGIGAFYACRGLESLTIPESVTRIEGAAFYSCRLLESVIIPKNVTWLGAGAFVDCSGLESVTILSGDITVGDGTVDPVTNVEYGYYIGGAFSECTALKEVNLTEGITRISKSMFSLCSSLVSITLPDSVTSIGDGAFYWSGLSSIIIPNVTSIGKAAFNETKLKPSVTIPASIESIGCYTFRSNWSLESLRFKSVTPPAFDENYIKTTDPFYNNYFGPYVPKLKTIYVPKGSLEAYESIAMLGYYTFAEMEPVTISYDSQGGSEIDDVTDYEDCELGSLPRPTRTGYTFNGWFTEREGGEKVTPATIATTTTYYAQWTIGEYTITYDVNGGETNDSIVAANGDYEYGTNLVLPATDPTRTGYTFNGWYTEAEGGTQVTASDTVPGEDTTYYAQWTIIPVKELATDEEIAAAQALLETAKALTATDYTADSYAVLDAAIKALEACLAGDEILKAELDTLVKAVEEAMDALVPLLATDDEIAAAKAVLETAKAINSALYTDASYAVLDAAMKALEDYLAGDKITKAELATLVQAVKDAIAGLVLKTTTGTTVTTGTTTTKAPTTVTVKVPKVAKVKKLKAKSVKKKTLKVTWKKVKKANGYKVQVSKAKKFSKKKIVFKKTINKNVKKLIVKSKKIKSGKKYFVRAKAYKTYTGANGKTLKAWGKWTKTKKAFKVK